MGGATRLTANQRRLLALDELASAVTAASEALSVARSSSSLLYIILEDVQFATWIAV